MYHDRRSPPCNIHTYFGRSMLQPIFNHIPTTLQPCSSFATPNPEPLEVLKKDLSLGDGQDAQLIPAGLKLMPLGSRWFEMSDEKRRAMMFIYTYDEMIYYVMAILFFVARYHCAWPKLDLQVEYHLSSSQLPSTVTTFYVSTMWLHLPGNQMVPTSSMVLNASI